MPSVCHVACGVILAFQWQQRIPTCLFTAEGESMPHIPHTSRSRSCHVRPGSSRLLCLHFSNVLPLWLRRPDTPAICLRCNVSSLRTLYDPYQCRCQEDTVAMIISGDWWTMIFCCWNARAQQIYTFFGVNADADSRELKKKSLDINISADKQDFIWGNC